jgi:hypothetical protein
MYFQFGKKTSSRPAQSPDIAGALGSSFGRYLRYGRKSLFGRRYFGFGNRYPMFGKKKPSKMSEEGGEETENEFGRRFRFGNNCPSKMMSYFGRRRRGTRRKGRKGGKKGGRKPPAALIRACKKHRIKCTKKVGKRRVYKKVSVLKKQLRRKKSAKRRKTRKGSRKTRRTRRRGVRKTRRTRFGSRRVSLFGLKF